jgi:hypothetical protein
MQQKKLLTVLLVPSFTSAIASFVFSATFILLGLLPIVKSTVLYKEYMTGFSSPARIISSSQSGISALTHTIFSNKQVNQLLFVLFWAAIGLIAYLVLTPFLSGVKNTVDTVDELRYVNSRKSQVLNTYSSRILLRLVIGFFWGVFMLATVKFIIPFCALCIQAGGDLVQIVSYAYLFTALITLLATCHVHVLFSRLFMLKVRVYGGEEDLAG